jgi:hypothetical protein
MNTKSQSTLALTAATIFVVLSSTAAYAQYSPRQQTRRNQEEVIVTENRWQNWVDGTYGKVADVNFGGVAYRLTYLPGVSRAEFHGQIHGGVNLAQLTNNNDTRQNGYLGGELALGLRVKRTYRDLDGSQIAIGAVGRIDHRLFPKASDASQIPNALQPYVGAYGRVSYDDNWNFTVKVYVPSTTVSVNENPSRNGNWVTVAVGKRLGSRD